MAKKTKIFFPSQDGQVDPFLENVEDKLTTGGLALKYNISPVDTAKVTTFKGDIKTKRDAATAASTTAQQLNEQKDEFTYKCKLFLNKMGRDIQDHASFDSADLEALGFTVISPPIDVNTAQPKITGKMVLPDMIIIEWLRLFFQGVRIYASYDGVAWTALDKDFKSPYEDKRPNKVLGTPEPRFYKLRYLLNDVEVGLDSEVIKILADIG
jgi:hypothetical protein